MAGRFRAIIFLAATSCCGLAQDAQQSPSPQPSAAENPPPPGHNFEKHNRPFLGALLKSNADDPKEVEKLLERVPPEQREKFRENLQRWQFMSPDEKKALKDLADIRRQRVLQEIDKSIEQSGLQLDKDSREKYIQRYTQERRKIEQQLQREMEAKRQPLIQEMIARLKGEFMAAATPEPSASPSPPAQ